MGSVLQAQSLKLAQSTFIWCLSKPVWLPENTQFISFFFISVELGAITVGDATVCTGNLCLTEIAVKQPLQDLWLCPLINKNLCYFFIIITHITVLWENFSFNYNSCFLFLREDLLKYHKYFYFGNRKQRQNSYLLVNKIIIISITWWKYKCFQNIVHCIVLLIREK